MHLNLLVSISFTLECKGLLYTGCGHSFDNVIAWGMISKVMRMQNSMWKL